MSSGEEPLNSVKWPELVKSIAVGAAIVATQAFTEKAAYNITKTGIMMETSHQNEQRGNFYLRIIVLSFGFFHLY